MPKKKRTKRSQISFEGTDIEKANREIDRDMKQNKKPMYQGFKTVSA